MWIEHSRLVLEGKLEAAMEEAAALPDGPEREALLLGLERLRKVVETLPEAPCCTLENEK